MKLKNKVAIVTGSSRGIGRAIVESLVKRGVKVVVNSKDSVSEGKSFVKLLVSKGYDAIYVNADISRRRDVEKLFSEAENCFGHVDILINNAGVFYGLDFGRKQTFEEYNKIHRINGWGVYLCSEVAGDYIKEGSIVNISSLWGVHPNADSVLASGVKSEVESYTKVFASRYKGKISVNAVAPGYVETELMKKYIDSEYIRGKKVISPLGISDVVISLLRGVSSGDTLIVNG